MNTIQCFGHRRSRHKKTRNSESSDATPWVTHPVGSSRNSDWSSTSCQNFIMVLCEIFFHVVKVQSEFSVQTTHFKALNQKLETSQNSWNIRQPVNYEFG